MERMQSKISHIRTWGGGEGRSPGYGRKLAFIPNECQLMLLKYYNIVLKLNKYLYKPRTLALVIKAVTRECAYVHIFWVSLHCERTVAAQERPLVVPEIKTLTWYSYCGAKIPDTKWKGIKYHKKVNHALQKCSSLKYYFLLGFTEVDFNTLYCTLLTE